MSAGGISYNMVLPRRTVTLPSVEMWENNMYILEDPPQSLYTRSKTKVGETQDVTMMQDGSGDRIAEMINVYARGVNPMVSVNYSSQGTLGGQNKTVASQNLGIVGSAKLPYRIMDGGEFRPPVLTEFELKPLSRLPRAWTYAFANPEMPSYVQNLECGDKGWERAVKNNVLQTSVQPTAVYNIETPLSKPFEVKYMIADPIKVEANSGCRTIDITQQTVGVPTKEVSKDYEQTLAYTQYGSMLTEMRTIDNSTMDTNKYIIENPLKASMTINPGREIQSVNLKNSINFDIRTKNPLHSDMTVNKGLEAQTTKLENFKNFDIRTKDPLHSNVQSTKTKNNMITPISESGEIDIRTKDPLYKSVSAKLSNQNIGSKYIHDDITLNRSLPTYQTSSNLRGFERDIKHTYQQELERNAPVSFAQSNVSGIGDTEVNNTKQYTLLPNRTSRGGFENHGVLPVVNKEVKLNTVDSSKIALKKKAYQQFAERYSEL